MSTANRRGECPDLWHPMPTGDGLLVRLSGLAEPLDLPAWAQLCAAARAHGNGIVEVTRRGSIQIRGLRPDSASAFARAVAGLGGEHGDGPPVLCSPLAGRDPSELLDVRALAAELRRALAQASFTAELGAKVSVLVDGGGALHLDGLAADVRLRAFASAAGIRLHVSLGGDGSRATALGAIAPEHGVGAALQLLERLAAHGSGARAESLVRTAGAELFRGALGERLAPAPRCAARPRAEPLGAHRLRDGRVAVGIALAFGQSEAALLQELLAAARRAGALALQPAERHALLAIGVAAERAREFAVEAESLGFLARPGDPRRHVIACSGAPACASAQMPARAIAAAVAEAAAPLLDGSLRIHLSGCAKGCAQSAAESLTFVGVDGRCGAVLAGSPRAAPIARFAADSLAERLARLAARLPQDTGAGTASARLAALGAEGVAALLAEAQS